MPFARALSAAGYVLTLFFNCGTVAGWDERYYWTAPGLTWAAVQQDLAVLCGARRKCLTANASILGVRVSPWPDQDLATMLLTDPPFAGAGLVADDARQPLPPWDCFDCVAYGPGMVARRVVYLRGLTQAQVTFDPNRRTGLTAAGGAATADLLAVLANRPSRTYRPAGVWCIKAVSRDPSVTGRSRIERLAPGPNGCGLDVTTADPPTWRAGDTVHLRGVMRCEPRGIAGLSPALAVAGHTTTIAQQPRCCGPLRQLLKATLESVPEALYAITRIDQGQFSRRKTGGQFYPMTWAPAFQMQAGCCAPVSTGVECVAAHPCGMIMDFLRVAYAREMRTFQGGEATPILWFLAPKGAKVYQAPTVFRSRKYVEPFHTYEGVGEQMRTCWDYIHRKAAIIGRECEWRDGSPPAPYLGLSPCGTAKVFEFGGVLGVDPEYITDRQGRPPCCLPLSSPGGQREGGTVPHLDLGGEEEGGSGHGQQPARGTGGEREGGVGTGRQPSPARGGEREGGVGAGLTAGGQAEGGLGVGVQPGVARGGEREGGLEVEVAKGGEGEGAGGFSAQVGLAQGGEGEGGEGLGMQPPFARGGEGEGGAPPPPSPGGGIRGGEREGGPIPVDTISTACCPEGALKRSLVCRFSGGSCAGTIALLYDPRWLLPAGVAFGSAAWGFDGAIGACGATIFPDTNLLLVCDGSTWRLFVFHRGQEAVLTSAACPPLSLHFDLSALEWCCTDPACVITE